MRWSTTLAIIRREIADGKLPGKFRPRDVIEKCPKIPERTARTFLPKHRKGNLSLGAFQKMHTGAHVPLTEVVLTWQRFEKLTEARRIFAKVPCVYVQTDSEGRPVRVGKASKGLEARYRGGTGYALDAAMHDSGNLVFVAEVSEQLCGVVEKELVWRLRESLPYNNQGKTKPPTMRAQIRHQGSLPKI